MADKSNKNNTNKMLDDLSRRLGVPQDKIKSVAQSGNIQELLDNTDSKNAEKIRAVLDDPKKTEQLLNSPQAQALIKLLSGE